jgi:hypothetical protein
MKLLDDEGLERSAFVADYQLNRERNLLGIMPISVGWSGDRERCSGQAIAPGSPGSHPNCSTILSMRPDNDQ